MANYLFQSWRESRRYLKSKDGIFFTQQKHRLLKYPSFSHLFSGTTVFSMVKAVIILRGLIQKNNIETYLNKQANLSMKEHGRIKHHWIREQYLQNSKMTFQFHDETNQTIILPFFNRALNYIYHQEPDKLLDYPYNQLEVDFTASVIDGFEQFNWQLFSSNFTSLITLTQQDRSAKAYFEPYSKTILIVNHQGRLDVSISIFDRQLQKPNLSNLANRIDRALKGYFLVNREQFIKDCETEGLLSPGYASKMLKIQNAPFIRRETE
jgi:hypothetical protein